MTDPDDMRVLELSWRAESAGDFFIPDGYVALSTRNMPRPLDNGFIIRPGITTTQWILYPDDS